MERPKMQGSASFSGFKNFRRLRLWKRITSPPASRKRIPAKRMMLVVSVFSI